MKSLTAQANSAVRPRGFFPNPYRPYFTEPRGDPPLPGEGGGTHGGYWRSAAAVGGGSDGHAWRFRQATVGGARFVFVAWVACCPRVGRFAGEVWAARCGDDLVDGRRVAGADSFVADLALVAVAFEDGRLEVFFPVALRGYAARRCAFA